MSKYIFTWQKAMTGVAFIFSDSWGTNIWQILMVDQHPEFKKYIAKSRSLRNSYPVRKLNDIKLFDYRTIKKNMRGAKYQQANITAGIITRQCCGKETFEHTVRLSTKVHTVYCNRLYYDAVKIMHPEAIPFMGQYNPRIEQDDWLREYPVIFKREGRRVAALMPVSCNSTTGKAVSFAGDKISELRQRYQEFKKTKGGKRK